MFTVYFERISQDWVTNDLNIVYANITSHFMFLVAVVWHAMETHWKLFTSVLLLYVYLGLKVLHNRYFDFWGGTNRKSF